MKVDVISSETIKPSTPTPLHLTSYKFSFLDQLSPVLYVPLILFYPNHPEKDGSAPSLLPRLKETLSETLTKFYPLAGRIKDNFTIDCNDKGILYSEAQADCAMLDFLKEPGIELLGHFLPCKTTSTCVEQPITEFIQVMIQVTSFQCGGLALGVSYFHKILDGASANTFLNSWAALARGRDGEAISPDFNTAPRLFPAKDLLSSHSSYVRVQPGVVVVLKRFVFDASAIRTLKGKAKSEHMSNPSSVEALSGFIWKHVMLASNEVNSGDERASLFVHSVNMRNRSIPPLPEGSMGNLYSLAPAASYDQIEKEEEPHALASKVREAISKVKDESVKALQTEEGFMKTYKAMAGNPTFKNSSKYWCTSWCRLGFNEVDFGWGKPIWVCPPFDTKTSQHKNQIILIGYDEDGRIEAWMVLDEREMERLERDQEFLAFGTPNKGLFAPLL